MIRILIAEDEPAIRELLATILRRHTFHVSTARDGADALGQIDAGFRPDVLLLDLMMPNVSGWAVIAELQRRRDPLAARIIVLTAASDREVLELPNEVRLMRKPFEIGPLVSAVREVAARSVVIVPPVVAATADAFV